MDLAKFFTALATAGAKGEASAEDMMRGYSDAGDANPMPDDGAWFMPEEGGGFLGRPKGWER